MAVFKDNQLTKFLEIYHKALVSCGEPPAPLRGCAT